MTVAFPTIFSNIWSRSTIVGQGCPDVNNSDTNYDDADSNSPSYNCKVLVTEWDQWQDITYLWRQLMMWSVGWLWFPGDHYLPHDQWHPAAASKMSLSLVILHKMSFTTHDLWLSNIGPFGGRLSSGRVWMMLQTQNAYSDCVPKPVQNNKKSFWNLHDACPVLGVLFYSCRCRW